MHRTRCCGRWPRSPPRATRRRMRRCGSRRRRSPTIRRSISTRTCAASRFPGRGTERAMLDLCGVARRATVRPGAAAVGVHAHRRPPRRPRRAPAEDPPHDHRRRRRAAALARVRRLRARRAGRRVTNPVTNLDSRRERATPARSDAHRGDRRRDPQRRPGPAAASATPRHVAHASRRVARPHRRHRTPAALVTTPGAQHRARPLRRDVGSLARAGTSRCTRSRSPTLLAAAHKLGGSINDAYVTGLAGALGRYHERFESSVDELRLAMPISTRSRGDDAANRFVPARVVIPIQPSADVVEALRARARALGRGEERDRDRRGRGSRGALHRPAHRVPRRDDAGADPHDRLRGHRTCAAARSPSTSRASACSRTTRSARAPAPRSTRRC